MPFPLSADSTISIVLIHLQVITNQGKKLDSSVWKSSENTVEQINDSKTTLNRFELGNYEDCRSCAPQSNYLTSDPYSVQS
jgi:hypothetical protein